MVTNSDTTILTLLNTNEQGFPEPKQDLPPWLQEYYQFDNHRYSIDSVILYKDGATSL